MRGRTSGKRRPTSRRPTIAGAMVAASLALPAIALGHLERPSYWPDPTPDTSVSPPAGGEVPKARSLASAVTGQGPGRRARGLQEGEARSTLALRVDPAAPAEQRLPPAARASPRHALRQEEGARRMRRINRALRRSSCSYRSVQAAVNDSGNNDRDRDHARPLHRAEVAQGAGERPEVQPVAAAGDQSGAPTPSYEYQATCPNDQNLIHVAGRAVKGKPLAEPRPDRHGIPEQELGECIRCNLQIEGSGAKPEDVILDAGKGYKNPKDPAARPGGDSPAAECHTEEGRQPLLGEARGPAHRPLGRLRRPQLPHARRARARLLHRGDRRHPARPGEVLLERRLRPPELHHRPQRDPELRRVRLRRRGRLPGRLAADRRVPRRELLPRAALQHGRPPCDLHGSRHGLLRARWATPCG